MSKAKKSIKSLKKTKTVILKYWGIENEVHKGKSSYMKVRRWIGADGMGRHEEKQLDISDNQVAILDAIQLLNKTLTQIVEEGSRFE